MSKFTDALKKATSAVKQGINISTGVVNVTQLATNKKVQDVAKKFTEKQTNFWSSVSDELTQAYKTLGTAYGGALASGYVNKQQAEAKRQQEMLSSAMEKHIKNPNVSKEDKLKTFNVYAQINPDIVSSVPELQKNTKEIIGATGKVALDLLLLGNPLSKGATATSKLGQSFNLVKGADIANLTNLAAQSSKLSNAARIAKYGKVLGNAINTSIKYGPQIGYDILTGGAYGVSDAAARNKSIEDIKRDGVTGAVLNAAIPVAFGLTLRGLNYATKTTGRGLQGMSSKIRSAAENYYLGTNYEQRLAAGKSAIDEALSIYSPIQKTGKQEIAKKVVQVIDWVDALPQKLLDAGAPIKKVSQSGYNEFRVGQDAARFKSDTKKLELINDVFPQQTEARQAVIAKLSYLDDLDRVRLGNASTRGLNENQLMDKLIELDSYLTDNGMAEVVQKSIDKYSDFNIGLMQELVDNGRMDASTLNHLMDTHPNYIPHAHVADVIDNVNVSSFAGSKNPYKAAIQTAEGSSRQQVDPFTSIFNRLDNHYKSISDNTLTDAIIRDGADNFIPLNTAETVKERRAIVAGFKDTNKEIKSYTSQLRKAKKADAATSKKISELSKEADVLQEYLETKLGLGLSPEGELLTLSKQEFDDIGNRIINLRKKIGALSDNKNIEPIDIIVQEAKKYKTADEFIKAQTKQDYRSAHQLGLSDSITADKIDILTLKEDIRTRNGYLNNYNLSDLKKLEKLQNNPDADIKIFRASPKNQLNDGDWVTTNRTYANNIKKQNGGKVYEYTVKVRDLRFPKNTETLPSLSMASTFSYSPKTSQLTDIWNKANTEFARSKTGINNYPSSINKKLQELHRANKSNYEKVNTELAKRNISELERQELGMTPINRWVDGIRETWLVPNDVATAVKSLEPKTSSAFVKFVGGINNFSKKLITGYNLPFGINNKTKDVQTAFITAESFIKEAQRRLNIPEGTIVKLGMKGDDLANLYGSSGGYGSSIFDDGRRTAGKILKDMEKSGFAKFVDITNPAKAIDRINRTLEQSTRFSVFKKALESGLPPQEAVMVARDATVDFAKMGTVMKEANQLIPFLNARVQGVSNLVRSATQDPVGFSRKLYYSSVIPSVLLEKHNSQYKSYDNMNDNIRRNYWAFITGENEAVDKDGRKVLVPEMVLLGKKGEFQQLATVAIDEFLSRLRGQEPKKWDELMFEITGSISPISSGGYNPEAWWTAPIASMGPLGKIPVGLGTNIDPYTGLEIVPESVKGGKPYQQSSQYTKELMKTIGETINVSPAKIQFAISSFGQVPMQALSAVDIATGLAKEEGVRNYNIDKTGFGDAASLPWLDTFLRTGQYVGSPAYKKEIEKKQSIAKDVGEVNIMNKQIADRFVDNAMRIADKDERLQWLKDNEKSLTPVQLEKAKAEYKARKAVGVLKPGDNPEVVANYVYNETLKMQQNGASKEEIYAYMDSLVDKKIITATSKKAIKGLRQYGLYIDNIDSAHNVELRNSAIKESIDAMFKKGTSDKYVQLFLNKLINDGLITVDTKPEIKEEYKRLKKQYKVD